MRGATTSEVEIAHGLSVDPIASVDDEDDLTLVMPKRTSAAPPADGTPSFPPPSARAGQAGHPVLPFRRVAAVPRPEPKAAPEPSPASIPPPPPPPPPPSPVRITLEAPPPPPAAFVVDAPSTVSVAPPPPAPLEAARPLARIVLDLTPARMLPVLAVALFGSTLLMFAVGILLGFAARASSAPTPRASDPSADPTHAAQCTPPAR